MVYSKQTILSASIAAAMLLSPIAANAGGINHYGSKSFYKGMRYQGIKIPNHHASRRQSYAERVVIGNTKSKLIDRGVKRYGKKLRFGVRQGVKFGVKKLFGAGLGLLEYPQAF